MGCIDKSDLSFRLMRENFDLMEKMMKKTKTRKRIIIILLSIVILMIVGWWIFCVKMYNDNFNIRCEDYEPLMLLVEDFGGLQCK